MRKLLLTSLALLTFSVGFAQTIDELKAEQAAKKDSISAIQGRVDALQGQIDAFPGWKIRAFGTIGANLSKFNNWYSQGTPDNSSGNIGVTVNAIANLDREKFFWRNSANANFQWVKLDDKNDPTDAEGFDNTTDVFNITSLYGYKLNKNFAISALAEYRTSIINNFNDPGYLDFGVGATWTPIPDMVVVIHPLNYNFVFADNDAAYDSSAGAKIVVDYAKQLGSINFKTNFSTFQSYKSGDLSNWTWINSFGYTLWKGIGVGFEFGLRDNKQEGLANALVSDANASFDNLDNVLQSYYLFGLNYSF
ncbi:MULTISPECIES: DUF3078 domain-containing protein [Zobellia]|uniref:DUF3078 domain-containing protein n=1 Tax=Zobellia TaxID=112040 RepID=UPI001BFF12E6|nr:MULTISPECIES: DUF3078 domain-containing protein [Zobellia]MBT9186868.1 DUF3078 domain-containing protein [Zobellia russellii]MBU2974803.1 DUF3078 domain-containing protein [Zobellia sp. B3R18]MDO6818254.1 DUF3078 domain-containing protein [Zobellia sp. 1_MG-2023]